jgi:lysylphosphatidylglycerol synthetase-like protein (DUF2156 family)
MVFFGKYNSRLLGMIIFNVLALFIFGLLIARDAVPAYPEGPALVVLLIIVDVLVLRTVDVRTLRNPETRTPRILPLQVLAVLFTLGAIPGLVVFVRAPTGPRALQVAGSAVMIGLVCLLINRIRQAGKNQVRK